MAAMLRLKMQGELTVFCQFITIRNLVNYYRALDYETSIAEIVIHQINQISSSEDTRSNLWKPPADKTFFASVSFDEEK